MDESYHEHVVLSKFVVKNDRVDAVKRAFRERPGQVDGAPGFLRLEVLCPADRPEEIWLMTWWADAASFERWHASHAYREAHRAMPPGLKLVPSETELRHFVAIAR